MPHLTRSKVLAARKSWQERAEIWREKIRVGHIISRLEKHANGELELSATQVKAAQVLLDRVMPTLSASEITKKVEQISPENLMHLLSERYGADFVKRIAPDYLPVEYSKVN